MHIALWNCEAEDTARLEGNNNISIVNRGVTILQIHDSIGFSIRTFFSQHR